MVRLTDCPDMTLDVYRGRKTTLQHSIKIFYAFSEVVCAQCRKSPKDGDLKRCSQCHVTLYCSRECQAKHWKMGGHKANCHGKQSSR